MHQSTLPKERSNAWKAIILFILLTSVLMASYIALKSYGMKSYYDVYIHMWGPGIAAILTCLFLKRNIASIPWRWGQWHWNWQALWLPAIYTLFVYLPVWVFGLGGGGFGNEETLARWSKNMIGDSPYSLNAAISFMIIYIFFSMIRQVALALGEEIGWRGFLVWEMRKVLPFWALSLGSGLIWSAWHWPLMSIGYNAGEGNVYFQALMFTISITSISIVFAYYVFKSNSLWPAVFFHASYNLFVQRIYTPITINGENTYFFIDEFGILDPIASILLGWYFYRRAVNEGIA